MRKRKDRRGGDNPAHKVYNGVCFRKKAASKKIRLNKIYMVESTPPSPLRLILYVV